MSEEIYRKKQSKAGRWIAFVLVLLLMASYGLYTLRKNVTSKAPREVENYEVWTEEAVNVSRDIAVQDGGRIKPFSTWAGFTMLKLHGDRSMKVKVGGRKVKLGPEEVLLDCFFRPEFARKLPVFRIDDSEVISSLTTGGLPDDVRHAAGMDVSGHRAHHDIAIKKVLKGKNRRDRYSYAELEPIVPVLLARAQKIRGEQPDKAKLTSDQRAVVDLGEKIWLFMRLIYHMDFARADIKIREGTPAMDKKQMQRMSYWIKSFPVLAQAVREMKPEGEKMPPQLMALFEDLELRMRRASEDIKILPPYAEGEQLWKPVGQRIEVVVSGNRTHAVRLIEDLKLLEDVCIALRAGGQKDFAEKLGTWKKSVHKRLDETLTAKLGSEVKYAKMDYFFRALLVFLVAFFFVMISWLSPQSGWAKVCMFIAAAVAVLALVLMVAGITHRSVLMERSPVGNLYDTIIFIGATGVLVLLLVELLTRRAVALGLAVFMGLVCMFLARRYEIGDAKDHMDPLVAVLKSNFWLSTHVVTVTIGYMGGLVAAGMSVIYLFARVLGIDEGDRNFRRAMTRIAYGLVCFCLFFSLIGTVLGGIWANDSWGRFWGWDPKENGALMIVLWCLVLMHARLAGWLREWGLHIATVFGANIVAFSWWHVNALSTGLHSYGFIDGLGVIWFYYAMITVVCVMGAVAAGVDRARAKNERGVG